jgi:hypothetical protein
LTCHELNDPLAAIVGYVEIYLRGLEPDAACCMEQILKAARRIDETLRWLSFSAAESAEVGQSDACEAGPGPTTDHAARCSRPVVWSRRGLRRNRAWRRRPRWGEAGS